MKRIKDYYESKKKIVNNFVKCSKYLVNGRYRFDETLNYIYLDSENIKQNASNMLSNGTLVSQHKKSVPKYIIGYILGWIFYGEFKINNKEEKDFQYKGDIFLPSNDGGEFKVFDLVNEYAISIFFDKYRYDRTIDNYKELNAYFAMPSIISMDPHNLIIIEELIDYKANALWDDSDYSYVIQDIFDSTIKYFDMASGKSEYILKTPMQILEELPKDDIIVSYLNNNIDPSLKSMKFPFIKLHGDMWESNILIENTTRKINYIDFEDSERLILFYDIFYMIWTIFIDYNNLTYIERFLTGEYDNYFNNIFLRFNIEYKKEYKRDYFNIFLLLYFKSRWIDASEINKENILNKYKNSIGNTEL